MGINDYGYYNQSGNVNTGLGALESKRLAEHV